MMDFLITFVLYLTLTPLILWKLFYDYHSQGKLSTFGSVLHVLVYIIHGMFMGFCLWGGWFSTKIEVNFLTIMGILISVGGLILTITGMNFFRSLRKHTGVEPGHLDTSGLYSWSRNPQFVGYGILLIGLSIIWYNTWVWAGIASYILLIYAMALIEEEHLLAIFGQEYAEYCKRVPRFLAISKK